VSHDSIQPVRLVDVDAGNRDAIVRLELAPSQREFLPDTESSLEMASRYPDARALGVAVGDHIVGFALIGIDESTGYWKVFRLLVDVAMQRRGIGRRAMELLLERLRDRHGADHVLVAYQDHNEVARRLYASLGFVELDRVGSKVTAILSDEAARRPSQE